MKFLVLIIAHRHDVWSQFRPDLERCLNLYPSVDYRFIYLDPELTDARIGPTEFVFPGIEDSIPGVLIKTMDALMILESELRNYDYVIRTNLTTIIRYDLLEEWLNTHRDWQYTGYWLTTECLQDYNIVSTAQNMLTYCAGTAVIIRQNLALHLTRLRHRLDYLIQDDRAIGKFFRDYVGLEENQGLTQEQVFFMDNYLTEEENKKLIRLGMKDKVIMYRMKSEDRTKDQKCQAYTVDLLAARSAKNG